MSSGGRAGTCAIDSGLSSLLALCVLGASCNALLGNELHDVGADGGNNSEFEFDATTDGPHDAGEGGAVDGHSGDAPHDVGLGPDRVSGDASDGGCDPTSIHSCGACTNDCTALPFVGDAGFGCTAGHCSYTCAAGYADCDDSGAGCTTALSLASTCNSCGISCSGANPVCAPVDGGGNTRARAPAPPARPTAMAPAPTRPPTPPTAARARTRVRPRSSAWRACAAARARRSPIFAEARAPVCSRTRPTAAAAGTHAAGVRRARWARARAPPVRCSARASA